MSKKTKGIVIGKFLPLHNGHLHLLNESQKQCDILTIVVCSLSKEPIDGDLRYNWVKSNFPNANVLRLKEDLIPQEPKDHPRFWEIWKNNLKKLHPEDIDFVFSSENYGERLAKELNAKHICIDLNRSTIPISGTKIRENPYLHWDYIPNNVRSYFMKRVLITGPESCGKTTLAKNLAEHFHGEWVPEFAREYLKEKLFNFDINDMDKIAEGQYALQQEALKKPSKIYFSDTSAIETYLYSKHFLGMTSPVIDSYLSKQKDNYDLVFLLTPDVAWVEDPLRNLNNERMEFFNKFKNLLNALKINYVIISGKDFNERTNLAIFHCENLLKGK